MEFLKFALATIIMLALFTLHNGKKTESPPDLYVEANDQASCQDTLLKALKKIEQLEKETAEAGKKIAALELKNKTLLTSGKLLLRTIEECPAHPVLNADSIRKIFEEGPSVKANPQVIPVQTLTAR